jgi:hypothetical protein
LPKTPPTALDVVGFSQFKRFYQEAMEERAQTNSGRITKSEFLTAICDPFKRAFTPENIKKGFEKTGTWPINQQKITAEMMAPSVGLSGKSKPIVNLNSPIKNTLQLIDAFSSLRVQSPPVQATTECPLPASQDSSLPNDLAPSPSSSSINSLFDGYQGTRAAFLFDGSPPSSANAIPAVSFPLPDEPKLSSASTYPIGEWQLATLTKGALIDQIAKLQCDVKLLMEYSESVTLLTRPINAQLTLLALENQTLRAGLRFKEGQKKTARNTLFEGGRGKEATGEVFMALQATLEDRVAQAKADAAKRKADLAKRKAIWEVRKAEHEKKKQDIIVQGFPAAKAGPAPLLRDVILEGEENESAMAAKSARNIRKGKSRQRRDSIDSLLGEEFDLEELDSEKESEVWSAHDESEEE